MEESSPETVKPKIWFLFSKPITSERANYNVAGALCVDKSGLLMTTTFGVCPRTELFSKKNRFVKYLSNPEDFSVIAYDSMNIGWDVELVYKCPEFGILFYQIVNAADDRITFDFVNLNAIQEEIPLKDVFAYLHHNRLTYSTLSAITSYPLPPENLIFPDDVSDSIAARLTSDETDKLYFDIMDCDPPYRMVENTIDIKACNKGSLPKSKPKTRPPNPDDDILPEALQLYTKLPLIQFSGLECDMYTGSSGCSVFKMENNELVGLILFNMNSSCFGVPLSVLQHCLRKYKKKQRGGKGGGGGGGGGGKRERRKDGGASGSNG